MESNSAESLPWVSSRALLFSPTGKFELNLSPEFPLSIDFVAFSQTHTLTPSFHDCLEIGYIEEGRGLFTIEDKVYTLDPGDIAIVGSREFHVMGVDKVGLVKVISIHFMPEFVYAPGSNYLDLDYIRPFFYREASFVNKIPASEIAGTRIRDLFLTIHQEIKAHTKDYRLAVKTALTQILFAVTRHYGYLEVVPNVPSQRLVDVERLRGALAFIRKNYDEKLTLDRVAKAACMSPQYFCRFFKRITGTSLTDYVLRLRIDRSMELLLSTDKPVTEIAYEVGFGGHSYFDRIFRRLNGLSPQVFRQNGNHHQPTARDSQRVLAGKSS